MTWCVESIETWFLLRLVGVELGLFGAFALEVPLGLLRSIAFFAPAGLGVQDLGYATAFAALGGATSGAALAFVMLKRGKELLWIAIGWLLFLVRRTTTAHRVTAAPAEA